MVLPGAGVASAYEFAERLRQGIEAHAPFSLTISAGVAAGIAPSGAVLAEAADQALFAAKRAGRNTTRTATDSQLESASELIFGGLIHRMRPDSRPPSARVRPQAAQR